MQQFVARFVSIAFAWPLLYRYFLMSNNLCNILWNHLPESEAGPLALGLSRHLERGERPFFERAQIVQLHLYQSNSYLLL